MDAYTPSKTQLIESFLESIDYLRLAEKEARQAEIDIFGNQNYIYCWHDTNNSFSVWNEEFSHRAKETIKMKLSREGLIIKDYGAYSKVDIYLIKRDCNIDIKAGF